MKIFKKSQNKKTDVEDFSFDQTDMDYEETNNEDEIDFISASDQEVKDIRDIDMGTEEFQKIKVKSNERNLIGANEKPKVIYNGFDSLVLRIFTSIYAAFTRVSLAIHNGIKYLFKKAPAVRYIRAFLIFIIITLLFTTIIAPFYHVAKERSVYEIYANDRIAFQKYIGKSSGKNIYRWGYKNRKGEVVIEPIYKSAKSFYKGVAFVEIIEKNEKLDTTNEYWALINNKGKVLSSNQLTMPGEFRKGDESGDLALVKGQSFGFMNKKGVIVFSGFDEASSFKEGLARVRVGSKEYFVDKKGDKIGEQYDEVRSYSFGIAAIKNNGRWGYVDKKGKKITKMIYEMVSPFKGNYAKVKNADSYQFINKKGEVVANSDNLINASSGEYAGIDFKTKKIIDLLPYDYDTYSGNIYYYTDKDGVLYKEIVLAEK